MSYLIAPLEALTDSRLSDPERRVLLSLLVFLFCVRLFYLPTALITPRQSQKMICELEVARALSRASISELNDIDLWRTGHAEEFLGPNRKADPVFWLSG